MFKRSGVYVAIAAVLIAGAVSVVADAAGKDKPAPKPKSATLKADDGVVAKTGKVVKDGSALKVDFVAYKHGDGLDLKGGRVGTSHQPLHKFGLSQKFAALADVPCTAPTDSEKNAYLSKVKAGQGFTVKGNKSPGFYRVRVKSVDNGAAVLEFGVCP